MEFTKLESQMFDRPMRRAHEPLTPVIADANERYQILPHPSPSRVWPHLPGVTSNQMININFLESTPWVTATILSTQTSTAPTDPGEEGNHNEEGIHWAPKFHAKIHNLIKMLCHVSKIESYLFCKDPNKTLWYFNTNFEHISLNSSIQQD